MSVRDFPLALECLATLAWMRIALRLMPRRVLRGVLDVADTANPDPRIVAVFRRAAARSPIAHTCVHRSLALQRVLARRGMPVRLRIGIGRKPRLFPGHAWLEAGGRVVNDDAEFVARYTPLTMTEEALILSHTVGEDRRRPAPPGEGRPMAATAGGSPHLPLTRLSSPAERERDLFAIMTRPVPSSSPDEKSKPVVRQGRKA